MSSNLGGVVFVKSNGRQFSVRGGVKIHTGGASRETITGVDGVHGFTEKPTAPFIEVEVSDSRALSIPGIGKIEDETVIAEISNGKTYILRNAWTTQAPELDAVEASLTIRFEGLSCEELT